MLRARVGSARWIVSLSALTAMTALSIDMTLPAQPTIAAAFGVSSSVAQLTLSVFLIGFAFGQIAAGFVADALGRRRVLLVGLACFTLSGAGCALAPSAALLIAMRFVQGVAAASGPVIGRAMVRDTQPAANAARLLSMMMAVLAIAPMLAPIAGGYLLVTVGWRASFGALAIIGALFLAIAALTLDEALPLERRRSLAPRAVLESFARFFRARGTVVPTLLGCASFAGQFAYISASPFVLIDGFRVPASRYGLYFAMTAAALMAGSLGGAALLRRGAVPRRMIAIGASLLFAGGLAVFFGVRAPSLGVAGLMAPMLVYFVGIGLTGPSATALAMDPVPEIAGAASALLGFLSMLAGALSGWLVTRAGGSDPRTLGLAVLAMGVCALTLVALRARRAA